MGAVEKPVEARGDCGGVAEHLTPIVEGPIRGKDGRGPLDTVLDSSTTKSPGYSIRELSELAPLTR